MSRQENKYNGAAVRTQQWRLVYSLQNGEVSRHLSDISMDPGETSNVADQYPEVVQELNTAYDQWWQSIEPLLVNENLPLVPPEQMPLTLRYETQLKDTGIKQWAPGQEQSGHVYSGTTYYVSPKGNDAKPGTGDSKYPFVLSAGERRSFTANTIFRSPGWRKKDPDGLLRINPKDASELGIGDGGRVRLSTKRGSVEVGVEVTSKSPMSMSSIGSPSSSRGSYHHTVMRMSSKAELSWLPLKMLRLT